MSDRAVLNLKRAAFVLALLCGIGIGWNLFDWQASDWLWVAGWILFACFDVALSLEHDSRQKPRQWTEDQL